jgi:NOL1/NOP2/fmu family ribosome biogenesis protein
METPDKGWVIAHYKGFNLGWIKVLDNRVNNYYPKEWRILKTLSR